MARCIKNPSGEKHKRPSWYSSWIGMKQRCYNKTNKEYKNYGAKGVIVCNRWRNSSKLFLKDMGNKPTPKHTLDRYPNPKGNYELSNCRWATQTQQQQNRTNHRWIEHNGERFIMAEWARRFNLCKSGLHGLLKNHSFEYIYNNYPKNKKS